MQSGKVICEEGVAYAEKGDMLVRGRRVSGQSRAVPMHGETVQMRVTDYAMRSLVPRQ